jgi:hypothetical protein
MTETDWLACEGPFPLIDFLEGHFYALEGDVDEDPAKWWVSRKLRLWAVACCRRIERLLTDPRSRAGLTALERYVDGELPRKQLRSAIDAAAKVTWDYEHRGTSAEYHAATAAYNAMDDIQDDFRDSCDSAEEAAAAVAATVPDDGSKECTARYQQLHDAEVAAQAELVREVFGNPFRPVALEPAWLTSDVRALAHAIYAERAFDRMPILADALQDAGCENEDVLAHCRSATAPHVRGCWVVDLLLSKGGPKGS